MITHDGRDRVRTLRAVGAVPDAIAWRLSLERALSGASLRPRGFSSRAILCVRRLRVFGNDVGRAVWSTHLERHMERVVAQATRPFVGAVPAGAGAVVFQDEAELLACLAMDVRYGDTDAWWWRGLFGESASASLLQRLALDSPAFVPAAVAMLADAGRAEDVVRDWSPAFCEQLNDAVRSAFGLEGSVHRLVERTTLPNAAPHTLFATMAPDTGLDAVFSGTTKTALASLAPEARVLLLFSLALVRAPSLARVRGFDARLANWTRDQVDGRWGVASAERSAVFRMQAVHVTPSRRRHQPHFNASTAQSTEDAPGSTVGPHVGAGGFPDETTFTETRANGPSAPRTTESRNHVAIPVAPLPQAVHHSPRPIETEFAGLFYLVNVALHLELYADFVTPARQSLSMALSDFLKVVGSRVCGAGFRRDPLREVLIALAGRTTDAKNRLRRSLRETPITSIIRRMERRTALALGAPRGSALALLCCQSGSVTMSDTRVDIRFSLATHPLSIRFAGLDRNPGWVPAAGRIIEFHYA